MGEYLQTYNFKLTNLLRVGVDILDFIVVFELFNER